jgi:hypothetical protein
MLGMMQNLVVQPCTEKHQEKNWQEICNECLWAVRK